MTPSAPCSRTVEGLGLALALIHAGWPLPRPRPEGALHRLARVRHGGGCGVDHTRRPAWPSEISDSIAPSSCLISIGRIAGVKDPARANSASGSGAFHREMSKHQWRIVSCGSVGRGRCEQVLRGRLPPGRPSSRDRVPQRFAASRVPTCIDSSSFCRSCCCSAPAAANRPGNRATPARGSRGRGGW